MNTKKNYRIELRLSEDEYRLFQTKSQSYGGNVSALIRDAVSKFDDKAHRGKIKTLSELLTFYKSYQNNLSKLGGNFNQVTHRANELALSGKLTAFYFNNTIMPKAQEATTFLRAIKQRLDDIHSLLLK